MKGYHNRNLTDIALDFVRAHHLQIAFSWTDFHLHEFRIRSKSYGIGRMGCMSFEDNPRQVTLADLGFRVRERFVYEYDFGDRWEHEIRVEKHLPLDKKKTYPICIGGARLGPPEDCGGPWAYMALKQHYSIWYMTEKLLDILQTDDPEILEDYREEFVEFKYWFNTERFSRRELNRRFFQYATDDDEWQWSLGEMLIYESENTSHC